MLRRGKFTRKQQPNQSTSQAHSLRNLSVSFHFAFIFIYINFLFFRQVIGNVQHIWHRLVMHIYLLSVHSHEAQSAFKSNISFWKMVGPALKCWTELTRKRERNGKWWKQNHNSLSFNFISLYVSVYFAPSSFVINFYVFSCFVYLLNRLFAWVFSLAHNNI